MVTIKFSHIYEKMPANVKYNLNKFGNADAILMGAQVVDVKTLDPEFVDYDTRFFEGDVESHYPLPKSGNVIILFLYSGYEMWCTVRSAWPTSKVEHYTKNVGNKVTIEYTGAV